MEIVTIQKYLHTSPRKLRLVADMVRKMGPNQALDILRVTPKEAAKDLAKAFETVLANAKQQGLDASNISLKSLEINESTKMRRYRAGTRGRAKPFKRRMAHIKIVLSDELVVHSKKQKENKISRIEVGMDDSANNTKLTKGGKTESSKT